MENMNINEEEVQGTVTQEETAGEKENTEQKEQLRTFTQDEVNEIVRKRLNKEREKITKAFQEGSKESDLEERERNILKRELKADTLEKLAAAGMPYSLSELIDYSSKEECEKSLATVSKVFNAAVNEAVKSKARQSTPMDGYSYYGGADSIANAFQIKR